MAHQVLPDGRVLALVCDGMAAPGGQRRQYDGGGHYYGRVPGGGGEVAHPGARLKAAAASANRRIFQRAAGEERCAGMGTTLVAALADGEEALILNEGDSRAYHLSEEGGIVRVTRDHSLVEDLVQRESSPGSRPAPIPIKT